MLFLLSIVGCLYFVVAAKGGGGAGAAIGAALCGYLTGIFSSLLTDTSPTKETP